METRTKWITALMIALVAAGVFTILPGIMAEGEQLNEVRIAENKTTNNDVQAIKRWAACNLIKNPGWIRYVLKNGTPETLDGIAEVLAGHILVMDVDGEQINVVVPGKWVVDSEVLTSAELFDGEPFALGETRISVDTLMIQLKTETHTVTAYFAYKISSEEATANALLPFNISVP